MQMRNGIVHEGLQRISVSVMDVLYEGVERVAQATLAHKLQRRPTHPIHDVDFAVGRRPDLASDSITKLVKKPSNLMKRIM